MIVAKVGQKSLVQTSLVNSTWRKQSQLKLYRCPRLSNARTPSDYLFRLGVLVRTLRARTDLGSAVRRLGLTFTGLPLLDPKVLNRTVPLLELCPRAEWLSLESTAVLVPLALLRSQR